MEGNAYRSLVESPHGDFYVYLDTVDILSEHPHFSTQIEFIRDGPFGIVFGFDAFLLPRDVPND